MLGALAGLLLLLAGSANCEYCLLNWRIMQGVCRGLILGPAISIHSLQEYKSHSSIEMSTVQVEGSKLYLCFVSSRPGAGI